MKGSPVLDDVRCFWEVVSNRLEAGEPIKLNLGGAGEGFREARIPGFLTVDLRAGGDTDIVSNVADLSGCPDNVVSEVYASNVLEHFPHTDTVKVLKEWARVLKPGGRLWLSVPDMDASIRLFLKHGLTPWVTFLIWGDQKHPLNFHYINFTWANLSFALHQAGFSDFKRVHELPYGVQDASTLRDSADRLPISLNAEVTK